MGMSANRRNRNQQRPRHDFLRRATVVALAPAAPTGDVLSASPRRVPGVLTRAAAATTTTRDVPAVQDRAAKQADKDAQKARSKQYHIGIKEGGNVTKPSDAANVPDEQFADPVNYRYPMRDKVHADNAAARWGDADNRTQYDSAEQKIIAARIAARQKDFGEEPEGDSAQKGDKGERAITAGSAVGSELTTAPTTTTTTTALLYAPFVRRDSATWEVEGVLTSEAVDTYGTIFDYDSAKAAVERWAGNVREQHDLHKAVGRRVAFRCDDATRQVWLRVRISKGAPDTWAKIVDGTLTGFSIGAFNAKMTHRVVEGRSVPCYIGYDYGEVSVVDVPSNPTARESGLLVCRLADYATAPDGSATGQDELGSICDDLPEVASDVASAEPVAVAESPTVPEPVMARVADTPAAAVPAAGDPSAPFGSPELAALLGALPPEVRAQVERTVAGIAPGTPAAPADVPATPEAPPAPSQDRAIGIGGSGEGFQGNDTNARAGNPDASAVDDGTDNERPVGKAMLTDSGHTHEHTHAHAGSFFPSHVHDHQHVHQGGTAHSHPHMHNHAHHEHYGDPDHAHAHEHAHDHVHEFRVAAPDTSVVSCPQPEPVQTVAGVIGAAEQSADAQGQDRASASHAPFTGKHTHAHPAFGSQGDDKGHEHEHTHDGDANHDHHSSADDAAPADERVATQATEILTAVEGADVASTPATPSAAAAAPAQDTTRAGQRISAETRAGLHEAALGILRTCDCPICQDACSLYDPDDDGDDDVEPGGIGDTDGDAGNGEDADDAPDDDGERAARRAARQNKLARIHLTRAARVAVAAETAAALAPIQQQFRAIAARLTAIQDTTPAGEELIRVTDQLGEVRSAQATMAAALSSVQGLVEQIAAQPAPGGPILRAADRTLALAPGAVLDASAPYGYGTAAGRATPVADSLDNLPPEVLAAAVKQLQRSGKLTDQESQLRAATAITAAEIARTTGRP